MRHRRLGLLLTALALSVLLHTLLTRELGERLGNAPAHPAPQTVEVKLAAPVPPPNPERLRFDAPIAPTTPKSLLADRVQAVPPRSTGRARRICWWSGPGRSWRC